MKDKKEIPQNKARSLDYLGVLTRYPSFVGLITPKDQTQEKLFKWLLDPESLSEGELWRSPSMKELSLQIGVDVGRIAKDLKRTYEEILDLNNKQPQLFRKQGQTLCQLSFKCYGLYASFNLGLDVIPRVGENLEFYFLKPTLNFVDYHITHINHTINHEGQYISILLNHGFNNTYLRLLKEKAYLHGDILDGEFFDLDDNFKIEEKLLRVHTTL